MLLTGQLKEQAFFSLLVPEAGHLSSRRWQGGLAEAFLPGLPMAARSLLLHRLTPPYVCALVSRKDTRHPGLGFTQRASILIYFLEDLITNDGCIKRYWGWDFTT